MLWFSYAIVYIATYCALWALWTMFRNPEGIDRNGQSELISFGFGICALVSITGYALLKDQQATNNGFWIGGTVFAGAVLVAKYLRAKT